MPLTLHFISYEMSGICQYFVHFKVTRCTTSFLVTVFSMSSHNPHKIETLQYLQQEGRIYLTTVKLHAASVVMCKNALRILVHTCFDLNNNIGLQMIITSAKGRRLCFYPCVYVCVCVCLSVCLCHCARLLKKL